MGTDRASTAAGAARARLSAVPFAGRVAVGALLLGAVADAAAALRPGSDASGWTLVMFGGLIGLLMATAWTMLGRPHWRAVALVALAATVATSVAFAVRGSGSPDVVSLVAAGAALSAGLALVIPATTRAGDPLTPHGPLLAALPVAAVTMLGVAVLAGVPGTGAVASSAGPAPAGATTSMPSMPGGGRSAAAGGSMTGMTASTASPGGAMSSMAGSGTSPAGPGAMPAMPAMSAMGATAAASGSPGTSGSMPGMGGGSTGASAGGTLSLPTTSPAGPITWPLAMGSMGPGMEMVTPNCTAAPTVAQQQAAVTLVDQTVAAVGRYQSLANAKAAGYVPITPTGLPVVHYAKPSFINDGNLLDPNAIESLVYANTPHGAVLVAAMYLMASDQVGATPPMPGGCLTEWHIHTNLCFSDANGTVVGITSGGTCPAGSANHVSQPMIHVWLAPLPGGPLVVDAPDAQVVQAAEQLPLPSPLNPMA